MSIEIIDDNIPFLRNLRLAAEAHSEEDLDPLFELLDPEPNSRDMGKKFENVIGYNPITYYTEKAAHDVFASASELLKEYPRTVKALKDIENESVAEAVEKNEETREQYVYFGLKGKIRNKIREVGEVPASTLDEIMDSMEREYNLNYRERPSKMAREPQISGEKNAHDQRDNSDHRLQTSFHNTKDHPLRIFDDIEQNDGLEEELDREMGPGVQDYFDDDEEDLDDMMNRASSMVQNSDRYLDDDDDFDPARW